MGTWLGARMVEGRALIYPICHVEKWYVAADPAPFASGASWVNTFLQAECQMQPPYWSAKANWQKNWKVENRKGGNPRNRISGCVASIWRSRKSCSPLKKIRQHGAGRRPEGRTWNLAEILKSWKPEVRKTESLKGGKTHPQERQHSDGRRPGRGTECSRETG